jgi:glycosyltransferase involved in cell wall biosynthesis
MDGKTRCSLIIPTYNRAGLVDICVSQALHDKTDLEIVWVDDASTDNVREVMGKYPIDISITRKENKGVAISYNNGIRVSTGDWIAVMDSDLQLPENWLSKCREYINKIPETDIVGIHIDGFKEWIGDTITINNTEVREMKKIMGFYIVKREFFNRVGYYREDWGWYAPIDMNWCARARQLKPVMYYLPGLSVKHCGVSEWDEGEYRDRKNADLKSWYDKINNIL